MGFRLSRIFTRQRASEGKIDSSLTLTHPTLGEVKVTVRRNARSITARIPASGGEVLVSLPPGTPRLQLTDILDRLVEKYRSRTERGGERRSPFADGTCIDCTEFSIAICIGELRTPKVAAGILRGAPIGVITVTVDHRLDINTPEVTASIMRIIMRIAAAGTKAHIIPHAMKTAEELNCRVTGWSTGSGLKTLGSCSSYGHIRLSAALIFLPPHLRQYVICHELAHLTHMNHSAAFHRLCNAYCRGNGTLWRSELKRFRWPIPR